MFRFSVRFLRNLFIFVFALGIVYLLFLVSINFVFQAQIKGFLEKRLGALVNAEVNIKDIKTDILTQARINRIQIKTNAKSPLRLDISSVDFRYQPLYLFRGRLGGRIKLRDLWVSGAAGEFRENVSVAFSFKPLLFDKVLEIEEVTFYLSEIPTLKIKGTVEPIFKPERASLYVRIPSLSYSTFNLKDFSLSLNLSSKESFGRCLVDTFNYNGFILNNISLRIVFKDRKIHLNNLGADIFGGRINADAIISFLAVTGYNLNLNLTSLNLKDISSRLAPADWQATGAISGNLQLNIKGRDLKNLEGQLYSQGTGTVNMKAIRSLLSRASFVIEKKMLKEDTFFYESLTADISLLKDNIIVKLALKGEEADLKFDINIEPQVLSSFLNRRWTDG